ncbi:MAG: hypothetical protein PHR66_03955 [Desulfuromonadaceae bacterium]|nr:hypothetical protein [Desulfuromonadaceae bacterium]
MPNDDLLEKIKEIKATEKEFKISLRYLVNAFGFEKRTSGNRWFINRFLEEQQLETDPDYNGHTTQRPSKYVKVYDRHFESAIALKSGDKEICRK